MSIYIKLKEAPTLVINMPSCSACCVEIDAEADGLTCPCCGTTWGHRDGEGDTGTLYEEYSGDDLDTEPIDNDEAWRAGTTYEEAERAAAKARFKAWHERAEAKAKADLLETALAEPVGHRLDAEAAALAGVKK